MSCDCWVTKISPRGVRVSVRGILPAQRAWVYLLPHQTKSLRVLHLPCCRGQAPLAGITWFLRKPPHGTTRSAQLGMYFMFMLTGQVSNWLIRCCVVHTASPWAG